jgi:hypothetical protein
VFKLAAVVLGLPFPDKINRLGWCTRWGSLILTWGVARGFAADTKLRALRVQDNKLHISLITGSTSKSRIDLLDEANKLFGAPNTSNLQGFGY